MPAPANDSSRMNTREALTMSLQLPEPEVSRAKFRKALDDCPSSIAWNVASRCLIRGDFAGHDSAMTIFRRLTREAVQPNKRKASNHGE